MTKKSFGIILCTLCVLIASGCATARVTYTSDSSYVTDIGLDGVLSAEGVEKSFWKPYEEFVNDTAKNSTVVSFNGQKYTGTYDYSMYRPGFPVSEDYYKTENGEEFSVRSDTGKLSSFTSSGLYRRDEEPFLPDVDNPKENALKMAKGIVSKFINIENYECTLVNEYVNTHEKDGKEYKRTVYQYEFIKKIGDLETEDRVFISVSSKGKLITMRLGDTGAFDRMTKDSVDVVSINNSVVEKVKNVCTNDFYEYANHTFRSQRLCYTPDRELAIVTDVEVRIKDQNGAEIGTIVEITTILVPNETE